MFNIKKNNIIYLSLLFVAIINALTMPGSQLLLTENKFYKFLIWFAEYIFMYKLFMFSKEKRTTFCYEQLKPYRIINIYLLYNFFCIIYGYIDAEDAWNYFRVIENTIVMLMPVIVYTVADKIDGQIILAHYIKYGIWLCLLICIFHKAIGSYFVPFSCFILFIPALPNKWKFVVLVISFFVFYIDSIIIRSNVVRFFVPYLLLSIYFLRHIISVRFLELLRKFIFVLPFIFFILAIQNIFNVFDMSDYMSKYNIIVDQKKSNGEMEENSLIEDTRTILYSEVLQTAQKHNSWWFGQSPAHGNETSFFSDEIMRVIGKAERAKNEVAILNIFTWEGIIGVILYGLMFYKASYLAINNSNNIYSKMLGLYVVFRWAYSWVEEANNFSMVHYFLWIMIGLCFSSGFRQMNDYEIKEWIGDVFRPQKNRIG